MVSSGPYVRELGVMFGASLWTFSYFISYVRVRAFLVAADNVFFRRLFQ